MDHTRIYLKPQAYHVRRLILVRYELNSIQREVLVSEIILLKRIRNRFNCALKRQSLNGGKMSQSFGIRNPDHFADILESARPHARFLIGTV